MIVTKTPFLLTIGGITKYILSFEDQGMTAMFIAKKYWIVFFMTILLCCHGFGLIVRIITYIWPRVIFHKKLQDCLEVIFKFFVYIWCISWLKSLLVNPIQFILMRYGFSGEIMFLEPEDIPYNADYLLKERIHDSWRLSIIFRAI